MNSWMVLYNPKAGNGDGAAKARNLEVLLEGEKHYTDITAIQDIAAYLATLSAQTKLVLCGGDGTLSRFVNDMQGQVLPGLYYYAIGSGNDFLNDLGYAKGHPPFLVNSYIERLPIVEVNGQKRRFLNGVGYGVDGFVCAEAARLREKTGKRINYTLVALKCLLFGYKPKDATVVIDGVTRRYQKVWLAPAMKGRFFGGGMMIAPTQRRMDAQDRITVVIGHKMGKLRLMRIFPSIYKGKHVKHTDVVDMFDAREVEVRFDQPTALQIDGEVVHGVHSYKVYCE